MADELKRSPDTELVSPRQKHRIKEQQQALRPNHAKELLDKLKHTDPVLRLQLTRDDYPPDICPTSRNLLDSLLYPLSPHDFKSSCFRKKAVCINSNRKERVENIIKNFMFGLDPKRIFEETSSDSVFLWIPSNDKNKVSQLMQNEERCLQSIEVHDPNTAYVLHTHSNYASYCRAAPQLEQLLVSSMLKGIGFGLGQYDPTGEKLTTLGRGEVETFIGTNGHVTDFHTDFQENFTIQLSGRKRWTLKQGTIKSPLRGTTPHYRSSPDVIENQIKAARLSNPDYQFGRQDLNSNAFGDEVDIIMDAGDVLYFPAGMWHKVETIEEGVSINVSLMGTTYASLVCKTLEHVLLEREEWREVICSQRDTGCDVVENLDTLIRGLPSILEKLRNNGFAEGILPPVLRRPPAFELVNDEEHIDESDNESGISRNNGEGVGEHDGDDSSSNPEDDYEDETIVDVNTFETPEGFNSIAPSQHHWKRNPLASLMRMSDVKSFFQGEDNTNNLYIVNVNFAGNEMHESAVRVVLRDESGKLQYLCSLKGKCLDDAIEKLKPPLLSALIFYGYII